MLAGTLRRSRWLWAIGSLLFFGTLAIVLSFLKTLPEKAAKMEVSTDDGGLTARDFFYGWIDLTKKSFCFHGRADLKEFQIWSVVFLLGFLLAILSMFPFDYVIKEQGHDSPLLPLIMVVPSLVMLNLTVFSPALWVRRLHDNNLSAATFLWVLIPLIGALYLAALLSRKGDPGENKYGPSPRRRSGMPK